MQRHGGIKKPKIVAVCDCCLEEIATQAATVLEAGGLVVMPTDTVYGLAARGDDRGAVERIFAAKRRPADRPLPVLLASAAALDEVARDVPPAARALAQAFWPGPLTLVVPRSARIPAWVTAGGDTVGVRVPDHVLARTILRSCSFPVAVTSANLSDEPTASTAVACAEALAEPPDLVLEEGVIAGAASTVVEVAGDRVHILRPGPITGAALRSALAAAGLIGLEVRE